MHRSSESIAALVAALAKAQVLLTNPEKSLRVDARFRRIDRRDGQSFQILSSHVEAPLWSRPEARPEALQRSHRAFKLPLKAPPTSLKFS
jgi:hypothetical protein